MPGMPWVAAASVVLNLFLLGSVSAHSWRLFALWVAATLVFYVLYSLPASYAHSSERCACAKLCLSLACMYASMCGLQPGRLCKDALAAMPGVAGLWSYRNTHYSVLPLENMT